MTVYTILKEYTWLVNTIHHAGIRTQGQESCDSAIINYEKVISLKPTYARPYINEGEICEILGDKPRAIANYLAAMRLFAANNFYQETLEFANRVLSLDPTNEEANELVGKAQQ
jgi:tetratricopeptide (TPR) repeat protein